MRIRALNIFASALVAVSAFFFATVLCLAEEELSQYITQSVTISKLSGKVEVLPKDARIWQKAEVGIQLSAGDKIRTTEDGKVQLTLQDGSFVNLKEKTTLGVATARQEISTEAIQYELDFRVGEIMLELKKLNPGSSFKVETPTAVAAVRGTTFYLRTGTTAVDGEEQAFTALYVDSDDVINFTNTISGQGYEVQQYEGSSAYADGTIEEPEVLPPAARDAWKSGWDIGGSSSGKSRKGMRDVDEEAADDISEDIEDITENQNDALEDALDDQIEEQDTTNQEEPEEPEEPEQEADSDGDGVPDIEDAFRYDAHWDPDTVFTNIDGEIVTVKGYGSRDELRQAGIDNLLAIAGLRQDIYDMINDIDARQFEAIKEEIFDHQAAKVMRDRWGNRVRVEEYISNPTNDEVQVLALNLRTAGPNAGISSLDFRVKFDDDIIGMDLKTLPWDDYMHNPSKGEMFGGNDDTQLIVYENDDGTYYDPRDFGYPIPRLFSLEVKNPYGNSIKATETYGDIIFRPGYVAIEAIELEGGVESDTPENIIIRRPRIWYQSHQGTNIEIRGINGLRQYINPETFNPFDGWGEGWNDENRFTFLDYFDDNTWLMGAFYLIDDNGNLVDVAEGTEGLLDIRGIRDCINPDYNLEMVFFSSEFRGTPDLPGMISSGEIADEFELYIYSDYQNIGYIDVITIPEITEPYRY